MPTETRYDGTDFYCDVAIAHDDARVLAFHHTRPIWAVHIVAVPKRHIGSLTSVTADDEADVRALLAVVQNIARDVEIAHGSAAVLTNLGGYQDSKHLHVHIHSGGRLT